MSFNVLVIPEDFTKDQGILKPLIKRMLERAEKPTAKVRVCQNPRLAGLGQALNKERIADLVASYPTTDLFVLCVDRDGDPNRRQRLDNIETFIWQKHGKPLLAEHAWQEAEVWVLAGLDLLGGWSWSEIRHDPNPKERYYLPYAEREGLLKTPDQGRSELMKRAISRYNRIHQICPEDIQALQARMETL